MTSLGFGALRTCQADTSGCCRLLAATCLAMRDLQTKLLINAICGFKGDIGDRQIAVWGKKSDEIL